MHTGFVIGPSETGDVQVIHLIIKQPCYGLGVCVCTQPDGSLCAFVVVRFAPATNSGRLYLCLSAPVEGMELHLL